MEKKNKVLLIGWDAADWKIIDKLMANGMMPAMKSLVDNGVRGKLATLDPPLSPMLWTSIATGVRPYRHGVLGFVEHDGNGGVRSVSSHYRKVKAVWNMFTMEGIRSNVVAWWPSNPVESINGCMVSNLFQQEKRGKETVDKDNWDVIEGSVFPENLTDRLKQLRVHPAEITGNLVMPFVPQAVKLDKKQDKRLTIISKFLAHASTVHAVATELMETEEWDFTAVYHDAIDHFCHAFMKYHPPKLDGLDEEAFDLFKDVVIGAYVFHDMMLDRLLKMVDDDTTVIVISDHGFHSDHLRPTHVPNVPSGPAIEHAPYGIFVAKGPGIKKGERIYGASVLDITPTLLTLFNLPVGRDMDGKPLVNIYDHPREVKYIDSWENVDTFGGELVKVSELSQDGNDGALQQLVDLGYIDEVRLNDSSEESDKYLKGIVRENNFYLAKSFAHGGKYDEALEILLEIEDKSKPDFRYLIEIVNCAIKTRRYRLAEEYLQWARVNNLMAATYLNVLEAKVQIGLNNPDLALSLLRSSVSDNPEGNELLLELGKLLNSIRETAEARSCFLKIIESDPDNPYAYQGVGLSFLREEKYDEALDYFLGAIERLYHYPLAHFHLGETLALMKEYKAAIQTFELVATMAPHLMKVQRWLKDLHEILDNEPFAAYYRGLLAKNTQGTKLIVTGLPGKHLNEVMMLLRERGIDIKGDPDALIDDEDYLSSKDPFEGTNDKVVYLPEGRVLGLTGKYNYRIIFVEEPQEKVLEYLNSKDRLRAGTYNPVSANALYRTDRICRTWLSQQPDLDILYLDDPEVFNEDLLNKFIKL